MLYAALRQTFIGGRLLQPGDTVDFADVPPADLFVLANLYEPADAREQSAEAGSRFLSSSLEADPSAQLGPDRKPHDRQRGPRVRTVLDGRSPNESRY